MLSPVPIPGNPWPHDMVLTIENDSQALRDLFWVREAWSLRNPGLRSGRRASLLQELLGPSGHDAFSDDAFTDQYLLWNHAQLGTNSNRRCQSLEETPERVSLAALISAWQARLSTVIFIPCRGSSARVIGYYALLLTAGPRDDPRRYSEAPGLFQ